MAAEAEAAREARAKVIAAEGEQKASIALKDAADVINKSPIALQLRYLQTLTDISAERNSTIIFPVPIEMLKTFDMSNNRNNSPNGNNNNTSGPKDFITVVNPNNMNNGNPPAQTFPNQNKTRMITQK